MCPEKRLLGAFETDWAEDSLQLRHQPNVFLDLDGCLDQVQPMLGSPSPACNDSMRLSIVD
jgi:hypothetical protein